MRLLRAARFILLLLPALSAHAGANANPRAPLAVLHYQSEDKLVFLTVRVNDSRPLTFILDSGARHSVLDSSAVVGLGLPVRAPDHTTGAGKGAVTRQHTDAVELRLGEARLEVEDPWVLDLGQVAGIRHVDGLVGADLFERYTVRLDPVRQTLTLAEPGTVQVSGSSVPLTLDEGALYVSMTLTPVGGAAETHRVRIDSGSGDAVSDNLVRRSAEHRRSVQGVGLGQSYEDESGVFETVRIGPYTIRRSWGPSNDHPAVGMEILRRFTTTFEVKRGRLTLEPNAHLHDPVPAPALSSE